MDMELEIQRHTYCCELCNFNSGNKTTYNIHILTAKHIKNTMDNENKTNYQKYSCKICDFINDNKTKYAVHIATAKHLKRNNLITDNKQKTESKKYVKNGLCTPIITCYECICGNKYKYQPGLSKHKKKCKNVKLHVSSIVPSIVDESENKIVDESENKIVDESENKIVGTNQFSNELLYNLLKEIAISNAKNDELQKQNMEIKNMFIEHSVQLNQQNAQLMELANKPSTINNTMNKPKFNLNFFLNEECKNAMNWLEFAELVKSKICFADLEYIGKHGYVAGQSKIIKDNLQNIEVNKRPFHCTDIKRKTVHIKDQDEWKREEGHSNTLTKLVNKIEHTENVVLYDWIQTKPDCYKHNSPDNQTYMDIATAITKHAHEDNQDKALVEVLQNVMVEKK